MGYAITRIAVICIASILSVGGIIVFSLAAKKYHKIIFIYAGFLFCGGVLCISGIMLCTPFENLLYTFDSPEQIAHYSTTGNIVSVVEGEDSELVVYNNGAVTNAFIIAKKNRDGYNICSKLLYQRVKTAHNDQICIYRTQKTSDCYLIIQGFAEGTSSLEFSDKAGNSIPVEIVPLYQNIVIANGAILIDSQEPFIVYVNGEPIAWD